MSARVHRYPPHLGSTRAAENAWQSAHAFQFPAVVALASSRCLRHVLILLSSKLHLMGVEMASSVVRSTGEGVEVAGDVVVVVVRAWYGGTVSSNSDDGGNSVAKDVGMDAETSGIYKSQQLETKRLVTSKQRATRLCYPHRPTSVPDIPN